LFLQLATNSLQLIANSFPRQPFPKNHVLTCMAGFIKNLSINSFQLFINQALTLVVFFVLAKNLDKSDFGALNMILALLLTAFGILSFGIDQLLQKKMADGEPAGVWLPVALTHNLITGAGFYILLVILSSLRLPFTPSILLLIALGKMAFSLSMPYKQVMAGLEKFQIVFRMSVTANLVKALGVLALAYTGQFLLSYIAIIFLVSDMLELVSCYYFFNRDMGISFEKSGFVLRYRKLLKEAFPQLGTVLFAAAMARFDWIFIGFFLSTTRLAEYSFAYRVFEIALFPMLVIAPLLVPRFTKQLRNASPKTNNGLIFKMEMLVASFVVLLINVLWVPLAGIISDGKYGEVNSRVIFILSLSMPLLYYNNFLWSMHFAKGRTGFIFKVFAATFVINISSNLFFIPLWGNEGAAMAYVVAIFFQTIIYHFYEPYAMHQNWKILLLTSSAAMAGIFVSNLLHNGFSTPVALFTYALLMLISRQVSFKEMKEYKRGFE
jgi:O-antigen/teichoic acid export membrane protein